MPHIKTTQKYSHVRSELHIFVLFDTHHGSCVYFIDYKIRRKVFFQIAILDILMLIVI